MALRDVVLRWSNADMVGDESYELWLKVGSADWVLFQTGSLLTEPSQDFTLLDLTEGVAHVAQVRRVRGGRYRSEYLSNNPELWPEASRLEFTPGFDPDFGTPTINGTSWERTSAGSHRITVNATAAAGSEAYTLQLLRSGVVVDEVEGPHVGAVDLHDVDPTIAANHSYTVRHVAGVLEGPQTAPVVRWAGPDAPTGLAQESGEWYGYEFSWDAPESGAVTEWGDDYLCPSQIDSRGTTAADAVTTGAFSGLEKESALEPNGNAPASFAGYARHKVTTFGVEDVSEWESLTIDTEIANDETAFQSCP